MAKLLYVQTGTAKHEVLVNDDFEIPAPDPSNGWFVFKGRTTSLSVHGHQIESITLTVV